MSANVGVDLLCEEIVRRVHSVRQAYLQGDILPLVKHLAFAGRFRRIDLQPIVQQIRYKQSRLFEFGTWMYRPREANIIADHLAGIDSRAASALPAEQQQPVEIQVPAPYDMAIRAGAIILAERAQGPTILILQEISSVNPIWVKQFLLFGRGPCAQRLPRKVRTLLFGNTHQEVDMAGSFYEIMRRLSGDPQLLPINDLRAILTDILGLLPCDQLKSTVKRHPLIVMNAGASEACAKLEREFHISCPPALAHLSLKIEQVTKRITEECLPKLRPQYHITE